MASASNLVKKLKEYGLKTTFKRLVGRFGLPKLRKRVQNLQEFVDANLYTTDMVYSEENIADANKEFDGFICGSDQIWNPANTSLDSMYWLKFVNKGKLKISYAPSIGIEDAEMETRVKIKENLIDFDALSSREESGTRLINDILQNEVCTTVADPTFLVEKKVWEGISNYRIYKNKYIFAYILRGTKKDREAIERFSKSKNIPIVTIPFLDGEHLVQLEMRNMFLLIRFTAWCLAAFFIKLFMFCLKRVNCKCVEYWDYKIYCLLEIELYQVVLMWMKSIKCRILIGKK